MPIKAEVPLDGLSVFSLSVTNEQTEFLDERKSGTAYPISSRPLSLA